MAELTRQTTKARSLGGDLNKPRQIAKMSFSFVERLGDQVVIAFDDDGGRYLLTLSRDEWVNLVSRPALFDAR